MSSLSTAATASWLASTLKTTCGVTVSYFQKASGKTVTVTGVLGDSLLKLSDQFHGRIERTDADVVIAAADLAAAFAAIGGSFSEPAREDTMTVIYTAGLADTEVYEVLSPGNEPPWTWEDQAHVMMRIHGKRKA